MTTNNKLKQVTFNLDIDIYEKAKQIATNQERTINSYMRYLLRMEVEKHENKRNIIEL